MIPVARLNHAVLYVRDAQASADFYGRVFGFEVVSSDFDGRAVFMRAGGGDNHHDLGLFSVGPEAPRAPRGSTGLYHLAWEVPTIEDLATAARELSAAGALGGASDHGVSKSLYGSDPDGNEFEIMWRVPARVLGRVRDSSGTRHAARPRRRGSALGSAQPGRSPRLSGVADGIRARGRSAAPRSLSVGCSTVSGDRSQSGRRAQREAEVLEPFRQRREPDPVVRFARETMPAGAPSTSTAPPESPTHDLDVDHAHAREHRVRSGCLYGPTTMHPARLGSARARWFRHAGPPPCRRIRARESRARASGSRRRPCRSTFRWPHGMRSAASATRQEVRRGAEQTRRAVGELQRGARPRR